MKRRRRRGGETSRSEGMLEADRSDVFSLDGIVRSTVQSRLVQTVHGKLTRIV